MSDALLASALQGLESNQPAPALLWLAANAAGRASADAEHLCRRLASLLARRGCLTDHLVGPGASWAEIGRQYHLPECLLRALNAEVAQDSPVEGNSIRVVCGELQAKISKAKRRLQLSWQTELAGEFVVFGLETTALATGVQELRQKRIDTIYYDPKVSHQPRELHGLRFDRHVLQFSQGLRVHGVPDWDVNTFGLGLSASDAAIVYSAIRLAGRVEVEAEALETKEETKPAEPQPAPPAVQKQSESTSALAHVAHVQADAEGWRPVRVTAAGFGTQATANNSAPAGGFEFAWTRPSRKTAASCGQCEIGSVVDGDNTCTSRFTTAELAAISWPIEAAPSAALPPASDPPYFALHEQGAAWPPPTGWQLLQLGLTLTAVVLLGLFVLRSANGPNDLAAHRPSTPATRPGVPPKPIAMSSAPPKPASEKPGAPPLLNPPKNPVPAATSPVTMPPSPRVEPAVFVDSARSDSLPPVVGPDQAPRVTMEVLVPDRAVAIGSRAIYEIHLKNQSVMPVEGIDVQAYFSDGFAPDAADGAPARHGPGRLQFDRIGKLNAGESITLRIAARAQAPGAFQFRPEVTVANPPQKLHSEVTTRYYAPISTLPTGNFQR